MFKFIVLVATLFVAATSAGLIETHHVVHQPVIAKVGSVVHSSPSAVSHQSITQVHNKAVVQDVVAPVLKTTIPVHSAPLLSTYHSPVVHHYASAPAPVVKTYHVAAAAPVVHHSVPVVHAASAPLVKTLVSAPVAYTLHH